MNVSAVAAVRRRSLAVVLVGAALLLLVWTVFVAVAGGFTLRIGPARLSSHRVAGPLVAFVLAAIAARRISRPAPDEAWRWLRARLHAMAPVLVGIVAVASTAAALRCGSRVAADSDAHGYVSQAELWMRGRLVQRDELAFTLSGRFSPRLFAPVGYQPGRERGTIVPLYPPGLPMAMAAVGTAFGPQAMHLVVPFCAGLLVALAYVLGSQLSDRLGGLATAVLLAVHSSFLLQALQPMSDVPAACAWTAALALACGARRTWRAALSGGACSAAILIRPNLAPLAAAVALLVLLGQGPQRLRRLAAFAAGLLPGVLAVGAFNRAMYGSPFVSGYGDVSGYFALANAPRNLARYPRWLFESQGPLVFLSPLAPLAWRLRPAAAGARRPQLGPLLVFGAGLAALYAFYLPFDDWPYLRFLLPGLPLALALALGALRGSVARLPSALRVPLLVAAVAASLAWSVRFAREKAVFDVAAVEQRYVTVARYVAQSLPEQAAFVCVLYSGSLRYYAQRSTLRFDWLDADRLEPLLDRLERRGYRPYILLEDWEEPDFRRRFAATSPVGQLDWPPVARLDTPAVVSIWDPRDRPRHERGEAVTTVRMGTGASPAAARTE